MHRHIELEPPQISSSLDFTTDWLCDLRQVNKPLWASTAFRMEGLGGFDVTLILGPQQTPTGMMTVVVMVQ